MEAERVFRNGTVPMVEFLAGASRRELDEFRTQCRDDPSFDWDLTVNGERVPAGTPWQARSSFTGHVVQPHVLTVNGKLRYVGVYVTSGGTSVTVVPLRQNLTSGAIEVGFIFQVRPNAPTPEHPDCYLMAGVPRGATNRGESAADGARRELLEELCHPIVGDLISLPLYKSDANFVTGEFMAYVAWVGERDRQAQPDAEEDIAHVAWLNVAQILERMASGVVAEEMPDGTSQKVNWTGALELFPLLLAQACVPELSTAFAEALLLK